MGTENIKVLFVSAFCSFLFITWSANTLLLLSNWDGSAYVQEGTEEGFTSAWIAISAGIVMASSVLVGGLAIIVAIKTIAKNPEVFWRVLALTFLAGIIVVFGLLFAFMLWTKIR